MTLTKVRLRFSEPGRRLITGRFFCLAGLMVVLAVSIASSAPGRQSQSGGTTTGSDYSEAYRPQFHFSPRQNWTNDPNGLVYYEGEYHLFFQHNPTGIEWGNMTWGHAVSEDLIHWQQLDHAIHPDQLGTIFSGSAVIDHDNTAGFQTGNEKVMVAIYTSAGRYAPAKRPFTQSIAYSNDRGSNSYAGQTWNNIADSDGRRIWIGWMRGGKYPGMPFNQQMTVPRELTLKTTTEGIRLFALPVREVEKLRGRHHSWSNVALRTGEDLLPTLEGELWDLNAEIALADAKEVGLGIRGEVIRYDVGNQTLTCRGKSARLSPVEGKIKLRVLVDRASIEIFAGDGRVVMSFCFLPDLSNRSLALSTGGGTATVKSLDVWQLNSIWSH